MHKIGLQRFRETVGPLGVGVVGVGLLTFLCSFRAVAITQAACCRIANQGREDQAGKKVQRYKARPEIKAEAVFTEFCDFIDRANEAIATWRIGNKHATKRRELESVLRY
jgi:hypothetical protein